MVRRSRLSPLGPVLLACLLLGVFPGPASAAPRNDDFGNALPIRVGETVRGTTFGATVQRGEPRHGPAEGASVWYRLRSRRKVSVLLNTCRAAEDPVIAVYTGRALRSLRVIDFNDDGCEGLGSRVSFTARRGRTYWIAVAEYRSYGGGRFRLGAKAIDTPRNDDFVDAIPMGLGSSIAATTRNATLELYESNNGSRSVWFKLRGSAATGVRLRACGVQLAVYTGRRLGGLSAVSTAGAGCTKTFAARADVTYRIRAATSSTDAARFTLSARAIASASGGR
jgi:hypothetical protein